MPRAWFRSRDGHRSRKASGHGTPLGIGVLSCVIDEHPRFHLEALRWYASLTAVAGVDPADLTVHVVGRNDTDALDVLRSRGVTVRQIQPFDPRSPHCNKISGALSLAAEGVEGIAVLTDADIVVCEDPRALVLPPGAVASKLVDAPNPPLSIVKEVFEKAGVELPAIVTLDFDSGSQTVEGNGNGGLYLIPGSLLGQVATAWEHWARWLLDRMEMLGRFGIFVDQLAMALALRDEGIPTERLEPRWNTPTHVPKRIPDNVERPAVMHYHQNVQSTGLLSLRGIPAIDAQIRACNAAISKLWSEAFPNATFWEWRYRSDPNLGSGVGSRGTPLSDKRELLVNVLADLRPDSTLDVGSGDGEATRGLAIPHYTGIDQSSEAVRLGQKARPGDTFLVGTLADNPVEADLTICLDVLIHQSDPSTYSDVVLGLLRSARKALLVSGYESPPKSGSPMIHFHEPLSASLRKFAPEADMRLMREEHEISTWLVDTRGLSLRD
jgi:2-polyprenyl-3-methyl-5-hydroxy-6-metoxy-1,4-benzoquinol methylase